MSSNSSTHHISKYVATFSSSCSLCASAGCCVSCWQQKKWPQCPEGDGFSSELVFDDSFNLYLDLALKLLRSMNVICWMIPQFWELADLERGSPIFAPASFSFHQPLGTDLTLTRKKITSAFSKATWDQCLESTGRSRGGRRNREGTSPSLGESD